MDPSSGNLMQSLPTHLRRTGLEGRGWHKSKNRSGPMARLWSEPHTSSTINSTNPSEGVFPLEPDSRPYLNQHLASRLEEQSGPGASRPLWKPVGSVHPSSAIISHPDNQQRRWIDLGKSTTWEIHFKARISTTLFTTLPGKLEMMEKRYLEAWMPTKGKNIHLVCPYKQDPSMGTST